jgi:hypothetical protein
MRNSPRRKKSAHAASRKRLVGSKSPGPSLPIKINLVSRKTTPAFAPGAAGAIRYVNGQLVRTLS